MRKVFLPVFLVVLLLVSFSFSALASSEPFYVFDLSNLDAIGFQYMDETGQTVVTTESYNPMGFMSFVVEGTNDNRISGINGIFNFDIAADSGASRVFLQSGILYTFELYAWNVYYVNPGDSSQKGNFIDRFLLTLKSPQGDLTHVYFTDSMFTSELEYVPQIQQNAYLMSFTLDGSLYSGFEIVSLQARSAYYNFASDGVVKYIQAFSDFNISAVNVSDKHWNEEITPKPPANSGEVDDYVGKENELVGNSQQGMNDAANLVGDVMNMPLVVMSGCSFLAGAISSFLLKIPLVNTLITLSLAVGVFAFLVNIAPSIFSSFSRQSERNARREKVNQKNKRSK